MIIDYCFQSSIRDFSEMMALSSRSDTLLQSFGGRSNKWTKQCNDEHAYNTMNLLVPFRIVSPLSWLSFRNDTEEFAAVRPMPRTSRGRHWFWTRAYLTSVRRHSLKDLVHSNLRLTSERHYPYSSSLLSFEVAISVLWRCFYQCNRKRKEFRAT